MYRLLLTKKAEKQLSKLRKKDRKRVQETIEEIRMDPFLGKQLEGEMEGMRSARVWPYRIIYIVQKEIITVTILRVGHRQGVYK